VHHEIRRVGLDDSAGARFANYVGLIFCKLVNGKVIWRIRTMSAPNFADAIAEKYGAPV
jgi:hypothetical protein